jgi:hypothetical protein
LKSSRRHLKASWRNAAPRCLSCHELADLGRSSASFPRNEAGHLREMLDLVEIGRLEVACPMRRT